MLILLTEPLASKVFFRACNNLLCLYHKQQVYWHLLTSMSLERQRAREALEAELSSLPLRASRGEGKFRAAGRNFHWFSLSHIHFCG